MPLTHLSQAPAWRSSPGLGGVGLSGDSQNPQGETVEKELWPVSRQRKRLFHVTAHNQLMRLVGFITEMPRVPQAQAW